LEGPDALSVNAIPNDRVSVTVSAAARVINMKTSFKIGKVTSIDLVDDTTEMIVISQFGKIIRIDTKSVRSAGRSTSGVRLLNLDDKVGSATVIPPKTPNPTATTAPSCNSDVRYA
jgi:DNA gyrase/topoisomerase IV subunit A